MRRELIILIVLAIGFLQVGCEQRPIDVAPGVSHGTWHTIEADRSQMLYEVIGISDTDVYAAQGLGRVLHFDGDDWSRMEDLPEELSDIWTSPSAGVYATGRYRVYRLENDSWTEIYKHDEGWLREIWASSPDDIHVGASNGMVHFDGSTWTWLPETGDFDAFEIWGNSPTDVYAVGDRGLIAHYNGVEWTVIQHNQPYWFRSVWGSESTDVYAASLYFVIHFDGVKWSQVALPEEIGYIQDIWGTSKDNVYILYEDGGIAHFNGIEWHVMPSNTSTELNAIWGASPDDIHAVGEYGKIMHFDGMEWTSVSGGRLEEARFIWGIDEKNIYIGNTRSIYHFNGEIFNELPNVEDGLETFDVWGRTPDDLISVGKYGKIYHYDGTRWIRSESHTDQHLYAASGISDGSMVAVGEGRAVLFWDGVQWTPLSPLCQGSCGEAFFDVWMISRNECFVVGENGLVGWYRNDVWHFERMDTRELYSVWGTSSASIFASGLAALYHFDGSSWKRMPYPNYFDNFFYAERFHTIRGTSPSSVFVADYYGALYHFDGNVWTPVSNDPDENYCSFWISSSNNLYAIPDYYATLYIYSE